MAITCTAGVIVVPGTVDGVDVDALRNKIYVHAHNAAGNVDDTTETISIAGDPDFVTATDSAGSNQATEKAVPTAGTIRVHNHAARGTMETDSITLAADIAPAGTTVTVAGSTGHITCRTIDGHAPNGFWNRHADHLHGAMIGNTATTTLPSIEIRGAGGASRTWFRVRPAGGGAAYWAQVKTPPGDHFHDSGTCQYRALGAGGPPSAAAGVATFGTTNITTGGNVNNVDLSAAKTSVDAHTHLGSTNTAAHRTGVGGADISELFDAATGASIEFDDGAGGWAKRDVQATPGSSHRHSCSGMTSAAPT
jgi:hypothetical protein